MSFVRMLGGLLLLSVLALAQSNANKGEVLGIVSDANQAVVPGAKVKVRNLDTGFTRDLTTDGEGRYRALLLDPGRYEVIAESSGFAASTVTGLVLNVGSSVTSDVVLQVQSTVTTVEVGETLINVEMPATSTVLNSTAITNLPINGRRFQDFATLTPTAQVDPQRGQLSFAGQRGINSNVMLDGSDYNQPFFGGIRGGERSNFVPTIPQSAIQEFQVVSTGYSAEYGRSTGGILNTITKSGNNDYHGEAFYQLRHKELGALNPILNIASSETLQQFGGAAGGPIRRDRWFWFAAAEQQFAKAPRRVFFSQLQGLAPTPQTAEALAFFRSIEEPFNQTRDGWAATGRTDYQFLAGHRLTLRYNTSKSNEENAGSVGGALQPLSNNALSN